MRKNIKKEKKKRNRSISPLMIMKCTENVFPRFPLHSFAVFYFFCCCNLQFVEFLQAVQVEGALSCAVCFTAMQHVGGGREGHEC